MHNVKNDKASVEGDKLAASLNKRLESMSKMQESRAELKERPITLSIENEDALNKITQALSSDKFSKTHKLTFSLTGELNVDHIKKLAELTRKYNSQNQGLIFMSFSKNPHLLNIPIDNEKDEFPKDKGYAVFRCIKQMNEGKATVDDLLRTIDDEGDEALEKPAHITNIRVLYIHNKPVSRFLRYEGDQITPLHYAFLTRNVAAFSVLLAKGANIYHEISFREKGSEKDKHLRTLSDFVFNGQRSPFTISVLDSDEMRSALYICLHRRGYSQEIEYIKETYPNLIKYLKTDKSANLTPGNDNQIINDILRTEFKDYNYLISYYIKCLKGRGRFALEESYGRAGRSYEWFNKLLLEDMLEDLEHLATKKLFVPPRRALTMDEYMKEQKRFQEGVGVLLNEGDTTLFHEAMLEYMKDIISWYQKFPEHKENDSAKLLMEMSKRISNLLSTVSKNESEFKDEIKASVTALKGSLLENSNDKLQAYLQSHTNSVPQQSKGSDVSVSFQEKIDSKANGTVNTNANATLQLEDDALEFAPQRRQLLSISVPAPERSDTSANTPLFSRAFSWLGEFVFGKNLEQNDEAMAPAFADMPQTFDVSAVETNFKSQPEFNESYGKHAQFYQDYPTPKFDSRGYTPLTKAHNFTNTTDGNLMWGIMALHYLHNNKSTEEKAQPLVENSPVVTDTKVLTQAICSMNKDLEVCGKSINELPSSDFSKFYEGELQDYQEQVDSLVEKFVRDEVTQTELNDMKGDIECFNISLKAEINNVLYPQDNKLTDVPEVSQLTVSQFPMAIFAEHSRPRLIDGGKVQVKGMPLPSGTTTELEVTNSSLWL